MGALGLEVPQRHVDGGERQDRRPATAAVMERPPGFVPEALDFIGLPETEARRVEPLVGGWDTRRRGPRATRPVPVSIRVGRGETGQGRTLDLSAFGARIATDLDLKPGDFAKLEFQPEVDGDPLRLSAVVWSLADRGAVFVFANLRMSDFTRLNQYVGRMVERGS